MYAWINRIKKLKVPGIKRTSGPKTGLNEDDEDYGVGGGGGGGDINGVAVAAAAYGQNPTGSGGYGEVGNAMARVALCSRQESVLSGSNILSQ